MKSEGKELAAVTGITASTLIGRALSLVFLFVVARVLTIEDYGGFRSFVAVGSLAALFITSGATTYVARYVSIRSDSGAERRETISASVLVQIIYFLVLLPFLVVLDQFAVEILIVVLGISIYEFFSSILRGMAYFALKASFHIVNGLIKVVLILLLGFALNVSLDVLSTIIIFSLAVIPALLILVPIYAKREKPSRDKVPSLAKVRECLRFSLPSTVMTFAHYSTLNLAIPVALAAFSETEASLISVAFTIGAVFMLLPSGANYVIMPIVAKAKERGEVQALLGRYLKLTTAASVIMLVVALVIPDQIISILFGGDYLPAGKYFISVLGGSVFLAMCTIYDAIWLGLGNLRLLVFTNLIGAAINCLWILVAVIGSLDPLHLGYAFLASRLVMLIAMASATKLRLQTYVSPSA